jgi:hypothetical protein
MEIAANYTMASNLRSSLFFFYVFFEKPENISIVVGKL